MKPGRILGVVVGLLIATGAVFLVIRGFRGSSSTVSASGEANDLAAQGQGVGNQGGKQRGEQGDEQAVPRWQSFSNRMDLEPPARPIQRVETDLPNPFDRAFATAELAGAALRLEGIAPGNLAMAMISGRIVHVGDALGAWKVVRIDHNGVSLADSAGLRVDLALGDPALPEVDFPEGAEAASAEAESPRRRSVASSPKTRRTEHKSRE